MKKVRLVHGIGINDVDEPTQRFIQVYDPKTGKNKSQQVWRCPFYNRWKAMLERVACLKLKAKYPTYESCTVCEEWKYFSKFKAWMGQQEWEGKSLDKDLLVKGNKHYSPETCIFVDKIVNTFVLERDGDRGAYPLGVILHKKTGKYFAQCNDPFSSKRGYLGLFDTPEQAHEAWRKAKEEYAIQMAKLQKDPRVANALIGRYKQDNLAEKVEELNKLQQIQEAYS